MRPIDPEFCPQFCLSGNISAVFQLLWLFQDRYMHLEASLYIVVQAICPTSWNVKSFCPGCLMLEEVKITYDYKCSGEGSPEQRCQTTADSYTLSLPSFLSKSVHCSGWCWLQANKHILTLLLPGLSFICGDGKGEWRHLPAIFISDQHDFWFVTMSKLQDFNTWERLGCPVVGKRKERADSPN